MHFFFLVVINSYQKYIPSVLLYLSDVFLAFYLVDSGINILLVFEFYNDSRFVNILAWNENKISKALASSEFAMHDVVVLSIDVCYGQNTGE